MKNFISKPYRWALIFSVLVICAFSFVLLDTFVIPKTIATAATTSTTTSETSATDIKKNQTEAVVTDHSYDDGNIKITLETLEKYNTKVYIADIQVADASFLKTAFAGDTYGRNIKETTSTMAENNNAILAINGDYYGFRDDGFVLRNGVVYRENGTNGEDLAIDSNGDFSIIDESQTTLDSISDDLWQVFSFGPALVKNGDIAVDSSSEVSQSMTSNPRTAIGQVSKLHYVIIVSDGRTSESAGLSLEELAQLFKDKGCTIAYNLDGGGSSTMYFNGKVVNNPTDGRNMGEREVSDIVYFGD